MTPKDKAKELCSKAVNYIYTSNAHCAEDDCDFNCALMVVDEILSLGFIFFGDPNKENNPEYWQEVRNEIEQLKNEEP